MFILSPVDQYLFPVWDHTNEVGMNISIQVFAWKFAFIPLGSITRNRIGGTYVKYIFNFLLP